MSVFRATARVRDPTGREWEIYAYRIKVPERGTRFRTRRRLPRFLVRALVDFPVAAIRAFGSDEWTIQAVSWAPFKTTTTWTTTSEHRRQVLAQIEGGLERGESPRPRNAQFILER